MLIPRRDLDFQVYEVLDCAGLLPLPRFADHDRQVFDSVVDAAYRIAEERFLPFAAKSDAEEPVVEDGVVRLPPEAREALDALAGAGFFAASLDVADGGLQLPHTISGACSAVFAGANVGFHGYGDAVGQHHGVRYDRHVRHRSAAVAERRHDADALAGAQLYLDPGAYPSGRTCGVRPVRRGVGASPLSGDSAMIVP